MVLCHVFVVRRKRISLEAEWADPDPGADVHIATLVKKNLIAEYRSMRTYANGLRTALHGGLQVTGSYVRMGVSGFSFKGV